MLNDHQRAAFQELVRAAKNDDLALMECIDLTTNESVAVMCMVNHEEDQYEFIPVGQLVSNPYEKFLPPSI